MKKWAIRILVVLFALAVLQVISLIGLQKTSPPLGADAFILAFNELWPYKQKFALKALPVDVDTVMSRSTPSVGGYLESDLYLKIYENLDSVGVGSVHVYHLFSRMSELEVDEYSVYLSKAIEVALSVLCPDIASESPETLARVAFYATHEYESVRDQYDIILPPSVVFNKFYVRVDHYKEDSGLQVSVSVNDNDWKDKFYW